MKRTHKGKQGTATETRSTQAPQPTRTNKPNPTPAQADRSADASVLMPIEAKATTQDVRYLALNQLLLADYQRNTDSCQVAAITSHFDLAKLGLLTVSLRDDKYYVVDGGHRLSALKNLNYTHARCIVLQGLSYAQEAELFRKQYENRRLVKPYDFFHAGLRSGDEACVQINKALIRDDFSVATSHGGYKTISAVSTLFEIYTDYGYEVLRNTLRLIADTWSATDNATQSECLLGIAEFVSRYGIAESSVRLADKFSYVWNDYMSLPVARRSSIQKLRRKQFCQAMVENYNRGLGPRSKKRLKWDYLDYLTDSTHRAGA